MLCVLGQARSSRGDGKEFGAVAASAGVDAAKLWVKNLGRLPLEVLDWFMPCMKVKDGVPWQTCPGLFLKTFNHDLGIQDLRSPNPAISSDCTKIFHR